MSSDHRYVKDAQDHHVGDVGHRHRHGSEGHDHSGEWRQASKRRLTTALILISGYMVAEVIGGMLSGSLALMADAGHMLTDAASIGLALGAMQLASRPTSPQRTFGYHRIEILAALLNALTLWLIAGWVIIEAFDRFRNVPDVDGGLMLSVGAVGLVVNVVAAWILHRSAKHSVNVEGAFRHIMADLLGSVGVVVSGVLVWAFGWTLADPILSVFIGILILLSTWRLLAKVVHVLLEGAPEHIDVYRLASEMKEVEGVVLIHDIHVWTIAPGYDALTAHAVIDPDYPGSDVEPVLRRLRKIASRDFGIQHITIQVEQSRDGCTEHHHVDHVIAGERPAEA